MTTTSRLWLGYGLSTTLLRSVTQIISAEQMNRPKPVQELVPGDVFHFAGGGCIRVSGFTQSTINALNLNLVGEEESLPPDV